jgi:ATP-dependent DNA ligase
MDYDKARYPLWIFPKIDGVRAQHFHGHLAGRSMDAFKNTALVAKFTNAAYEGFDGELTIDGRLTGDDLCSATTGLTLRAKLKKGETELPTNAVLNLFDWLHPDVAHLTYGERYQALELYLDALQDDENISLLPYEVVNNADEARALAAKYSAIYEGAIFRDPKAKHKSGRATAKGNDFWRDKPVSDKDCIITGFEEAETNNNEAKINSLGRTERSSHKENKVGNGMVGTILATDVLSGQPIRLGPGAMTHDERIAAFNEPALVVGHPAKYRSLDTGVKDAPRHARFVTLRSRQDMTPADLALIAKLGL